MKGGRNLRRKKSYREGQADKTKEASSIAAYC
jgi:hypothetical protein